MSDEALATECKCIEEGVGVFACTTQEISATQVVCMALLLRELGDMRRVLDDLAAVVASRMAGNLSIPVENAHHARCRDQCERPLHKRVRDRIVIEIKSHIGCLARGDAEDAVARDRMLWKWQQAFLLLDEELANGSAIGVARCATHMRNVSDPSRELRIEIFNRGISSSRKERMAKILNLTFNLTFFVSSVRCAGLWCEVVVTCKIQDPWIESNMVAGPFENNAF